MRFDINLATAPYEDARSFFVRTFTALAFAVLITAVLVFMLLSESGSARKIGDRLDTVKKQMASLDAQEREARDILNRPENQGTRDQAQFVNALLARRAFSWSQVFSDLEKIMPTQVHVVSINPALTPENQLAMKISVAGNSREKAIELVHNLEVSRHFRDPRVLSESNKPTAPGGNPDTIEFQLTALYVPELYAPNQAKERKQR
jgi:type IV pilus assembly protein PilN